MINLDFGRVEIIEDCGDIYLTITYEDDPHNDRELTYSSMGVSGVTREQHNACPEWVAIIEEVKRTNYNIIQVSAIYDLIMALPASGEIEHPSCVKLEDWMKYWAKKIIKELGEKAYFHYS